MPTGSTCSRLAAFMVASMSPLRERRVTADDIPADGLELPWAHFQQQTADWLELAQSQHSMHTLLEVDVTAARAAIREHRVKTGRPLSFNAYVVGCFARAIAADPRVGAVRHGRRKLLVFSSVDVAMPVESEVEDEPIPVPHLIRGAERKSLERISAEISGGAAGPVPYAGTRRLMGVWTLLPGRLRRALLRLVLSDGRRRKRLMGTTLVTAVGLPGRGRAWGLPNGSNYPVALVIGGLRLGQDGRETVALTLTFDHDTVNGAPAARFVRRFARSLERGELIGEGAREVRPSAYPAPS